ncbi:asparagine synthase family protein, putative [Babesia ovis]|uniref:Asparagine synthase family protein, putative n=1 Tax=Babesia ovis TaxID=5869 RepID=A0A9W5WUD5_BABOV|nr:asparagine synthase family protein, putative [Babesia ovis]
MKKRSSIKLCLRFKSEIDGWNEVEDKLIRCNKDGIVSTEHRGIGYSVASTAPDNKNSAIFTGGLGTFQRDSLDITETGGMLVTRFQSSCGEVELCGSNVHILGDAIVAVYGNINSGWEDRVPIQGTEKHIIDTIFSLEGSFSLVYICFKTNFIYISKDEIGFKSLLIAAGKGEITVTDVATKVDMEWYEIPPDYMVTLGNRVNLIVRPENKLYALRNQKCMSYNDVAEDDVKMVIEQVSHSIGKAVKLLCDRRTQRDRVTVLFSGGLDSAILAAMVAQHVKDVEFIELINVAFKPKVAPDRITALCTYEDLTEIYPDVNFKLVLVDVNTEDYKHLEQYLFSTIIPNNTHMDLNIAAALHYAVSLRGALLDPHLLLTPEWEQVKQNIALLKSINIRVTVSMKDDGEDYQDKVETRCEGGDGDLIREDDKIVTEAQQINVDGSYNMENRKKHEIGTKNNKHDYEECESVEGFHRLLATSLREPEIADGAEEYISQSREVLIGSGADELFGGYGRHVVSHGTGGISTEVDKDIRRLWKRNLGRDDRIVNAQGITALYPYLHDEVINTLAGLKINASTAVDALHCPEWFKKLGVYKNIHYDTLRNCEFIDNGRGRHVTVPVNKWILREIALKMGLKRCVHFKKRAIQFGTRSAKTFNQLRGMSNRVASDKGAAVITRIGL